MAFSVLQVGASQFPAALVDPAHLVVDILGRDKGRHILRGAFYGGSLCAGDGCGEQRGSRKILRIALQCDQRAVGGLDAGMHMVGFVADQFLEVVRRLERIEHAAQCDDDQRGGQEVAYQAFDESGLHVVPCVVDRYCDIAWRILPVIAGGRGNPGRSLHPAGCGCAAPARSSRSGIPSWRVAHRVPTRTCASGG